MVGVQFRCGQNAERKIDQCESIRRALESSLDSATSASYCDMPGGLHQQYVELRDSAMLGRIFNFANHIHDEIDAVVVIGRRRSLLPGRSLFQACCDPYHNELNRAERGSKPRTYFIDDDCDNDVLSALLRRLRMVSQDQPACRQRFAIILIDDPASSSNIVQVAGQMLGELQAQLATLTGNHCLGRYVMVVNANKSEQLSRSLTETFCKHACCVSIPCFNSYQTSSISDQTDAEQVSLRQSRSHQIGNIDVRLETFAPSTLLPAALLGLDCVKLLQGAVHAIAQSRSPILHENQAMRFAASNMIGSTVSRDAVPRANESGAGVSHDSHIEPAASSLNQSRDWYASLRSQVLSEAVGTRNDHVVSGAPAPEGSTLKASQLASRPRTYHYWVAQRSRNDSLSVDRIQSSESCPESWTDWRMDQVEQERSRLEAVGIATTVTSLGTIDTYHLGWLFQMLMIATTLEAQAWETIQLNRAGQVT